MKKLSILFFMCLFLTTYLTSAQTDLLPPDAKKIPYSETHHGIELNDDYNWMVDPEKKDPDVLKYIKEENAYTDAVLKDLEPLQEKLFNEMLSRIKEDDTDVPVPKDNYFYYTRSESGKPYSIHCRKKGSLDSKEEIILDVNKLAEGQQYYRVGRMALSKSHRYLAWVYDTTGTEWYILQIKDLETGEVFQEMIEGISSLIWANDDKTIYYSKNNETRRSTKVYRHTLGNDPKDDVLLFEEKDDSFYCWVTKTKSKKFILIGTGSDTSSEIYYLDANDPNSEMKLFQAREPKLTYFPMDHEDKFFIITDKDGALNNKIMVTDIDKTGKENWKDFIPARPETPLSCDIFKDYMVIYEKIQGVEKIKIYEFKNGKSHYIKFDEPIYSINFGSNSNYDTQMFRYSYTSLTTPWTIYEYDMKKRKTTMLKRYDVQGEYNPKDYKSERVLATAPDGTKVPISLVYKKSLFNKDGSNPCFLTSYGSFGIGQEVGFSSVTLTLLDRGFIFAMAHIRGGGDLGEEWHQAAVGLKKKTTFTDFIACSEYLVNEKYTSSPKLIIEGGSAGGMLMGVLLNMRPDLFGVVIASIPALDYLNAMLYPELYGIINYYEEWGDPSDKEVFEYLLSYCPYRNIERKDYPTILVISSYNDARVKYWSPTKWVAKMRDYKTDDNLLLLKTKMGIGHVGSSGRYNVYKDIAFEYAFMLWMMGIKE